MLQYFLPFVQKKRISLKSLLVTINLFVLGMFLLGSLFLWTSSTDQLYNVHHTVEFQRRNGARSVLEQRENQRREIPSFLKKVEGGSRIGMVNMVGEDVTEWSMAGTVVHISFKNVSELFKWTDLFPPWIDEEEDVCEPACPEIPMPDFDGYDAMNVIVAKLPAAMSGQEVGLGRDVFRLQVHLVAANLAVKKGYREVWGNKTRLKVMFLSKFQPMPELFRCDDLVGREGDWWYYEPELWRLEQKVALPVGSCNLALPLWDKGVDAAYTVSEIEQSTKTVKREAYATILHSNEAYVCGAITLAQSLRRAGTTRDLILLLDDSISAPKRDALTRSGWQLRFITRIRNPLAENDTYNYSKFRLWQMTEYDKIIFIDADIIVLRNLDILFHFPQISATGNARWNFNSGIMVIEPSNCTFNMIMNRVEEIISDNGGDQGFLNEVFVWWHRLPRRVNFLKRVWSNLTEESEVKNQLFGSDPPKLYSIHYLGLKPWLCYRDYDCNWDVEELHVYASDVAHSRWWKLHDAMDESLQMFCGLEKQRMVELEWDRSKAMERGLKSGHWKINVTDPRRFSTIANEILV